MHYAQLHDIGFLTVNLDNMPGLLSLSFHIQHLVQLSLQVQRYVGNLPSIMYRHSNECILKYTACRF